MFIATYKKYQISFCWWCWRWPGGYWIILFNFFILLLMLSSCFDLRLYLIKLGLPFLLTSYMTYVTAATVVATITEATTAATAVTASHGCHDCHGRTESVTAISHRSYDCHCAAVFTASAASHSPHDQSYIGRRDFQAISVEMIVVDVALDWGFNIRKPLVPKTKIHHHGKHLSHHIIDPA